jgi:hypothetical protein
MSRLLEWRRLWERSRLFARFRALKVRNSAKNSLSSAVKVATARAEKAVTGLPR